MAKRKAVAVVVRSSSPARRRVTALAGRGASAAAVAAREESHTIAAVLASALLGYAERENMLESVPSIPALGVPGTLGMVAWAGGKFMKSKVLAHVATGLLSVAAYKLASEPSTP